MRIIPEQYVCEICNGIYDSKEKAIECETIVPPTGYPIGLMYGNHIKNSFYDNITFAVANNKIYKHWNQVSSWACRDNGYKDSLNKETCEGSSLTLKKSQGNLDINNPTFKRMVDYLNKNKIPITVWDGKKALKLEEFSSIQRKP